MRQNGVCWSCLVEDTIDGRIVVFIELLLIKTLDQWLPTALQSLLHE